MASGDNGEGDGSKDNPVHNCQRDQTCAHIPPTERGLFRIIIFCIWLEMIPGHSVDNEVLAYRVLYGSCQVWLQSDLGTVSYVMGHCMLIGRAGCGQELRVRQFHVEDLRCVIWHGTDCKVHQLTLCIVQPTRKPYRL